VELRRKPAQGFSLAAVLKVASRAFEHKRKTLRNNLRPYYGDRIDSFPEASLRAEQLTIGQFVELAERVQKTS
jgi:16S rRNA A1518/A1519 N6-dimethyltransferase RsmA/KsgA/DIM1 with predicted DNA glycosylase/AP lyase activity